MKRSSSLWIFLAAIMALVFIMACGLVPATPTPVSPLRTWTPTTEATSTPAETALPPATATPALLPSLTATSTALPGATSTATQVPSALTPTPSSTPVLPTATLPPTPRSATPTFTRTSVPPTATRTPLPPLTISDWRGEYYANRSLQTPSQVVRNDRVVDLNLPAGVAPVPNMPTENWSARWSRPWNFQEGNYRFHLLVDDGARLWVAGRLLIDAWTDGPAREYSGDLYLRGEVPIQLDYYNHLGEARARLNWEPITQFSGWKGSYYAVPDLSGLPLFQRDDPTISFNWGSGSPRPDLPADNFSVRWSRRLNFQPGQYRFRVEADDGVRLWVDGKLVLDAWRDGYATYEADVTLASGAHDLRLDYYEHLGGAMVQLSWGNVPSSVPTMTSTHTPTATPTGSPTATPTQTPTTRPTEPATRIPTDTPVATATDTALPPTDTPVATATDTPLPPTEPPPATATDTPLPPTDTPVPIRPALVLQPDAGPLGVPFDVLGTGWPANTVVDLFLARPVPKPGDPIPVAQVSSDGTGSFATQLAIFGGEGWEGLPSALVMARSADGKYTAEATYRLLPPLTKVSFGRIPTTEERFGLPQPTYLALDSEEAWAQWFGEEPPPADPRVNWKREVVLGAFVSPQPPGVQLEVSSIVLRDTSVSVWLNVLLPEGAFAAEGEPATSRVLVRVSRDALLPPGPKSVADLQFTFLDASGRLLAQGPAGAEALPSGAAPKASALQAPAPEGATVLPEAAAPDVGAAEQTEPAATAPAVAVPAVETAPPARTTAAWVWLGVWIMVGVGLVVAGVIVYRHYRRSR